MSAAVSLREVVAERLLVALALRGVAMRVDGGDLVLAAPPGAIAAHEVEALRDHKPEVLALLAEPAAADEAMAMAEELVLIADRLHRHTTLPLDQAETLLATFKERIAGWRTWYAEHRHEAPDELAAVDAALCQKLADLRRQYRKGVGPSA